MITSLPRYAGTGSDATRRMRAAWRVFDGAYRPKAQKRYVKELRTVATALGGVRDMDVQLQDLARYTKTLEPEGAADLEDDHRPAVLEQSENGSHLLDDDVTRCEVLEIVAHEHNVEMVVGKAVSELEAVGHDKPHVGRQVSRDVA